MREDIRVGNLFPDYELPDQSKTERKLSFLQGDNPMVLMLCRGLFCPKDRIFLHEMVQFAPLCMVGYVSLVTITTDDFMGINDLRQGTNANWPFLYDDKRIIQKDLGIQEYTDPRHDPMIPHVIVLEPGLKIFKIYNGYFYFGRPSMHELHMDLREITKNIRPDWKIDTPEMRDKFENNGQKTFFPYGKSMKEVIRLMTWEY